REAGRLWMDLVARHAQARTQGTWLEVGDLERATKGGQYALGSQTVQALCQRFAANVETATQVRKDEAARGGSRPNTRATPRRTKPSSGRIRASSGICRGTSA